MLLRTIESGDVSKLRRLYGALGRYSERILDDIVRRTEGPDEDIIDTDVFRAKIRARQLAAIASLSSIMMLANVANCIGLTLLLYVSDQLDAVMAVWGGSLMALVVHVIWRTRRRYAKAHGFPKTASIRATGATVFHAAILALFWAFPAIYLMPSSGAIVVGYLAALSAGMVAGGALALYPIPLAAFIYTGLLTVIALLALIAAGTISTISFTISATFFAIVTARIIARHSAMFVTDLRQRLSLEAKSETIRLLLNDYKEHGAHWLWECDKDGLIDNCSPRFAEVTNRTTDELNGMSFLHLLQKLRAETSHNQSPDFQAWLDGDATPLLDAPFQVTLRVKTDDPTPSSWELNGRTRRDKDNNVIGYEGWGRDVTTEVKANERIHYLATRDAMTGLLNAAEFQHLLEDKIAEFRSVDAYEVFVSLMYLDADKLKTVNDTFGHAAGDALILEMGRRLTSITDTHTLAGRKGGDEFQLMIFHREEMDLGLKGTEILKLLSGTFDHLGSEISFHTSVGISTAPVKTVDIETILAEADRALYHAKENGGRAFQIYDSQLGDALAQRRRLAAGLGAAIKDSSLTLHYQPIVDLATMELTAYEALLRWNHPELGKVHPEILSAVAESTGQINELGDYILMSAIKCAATWPANVGLSVNISVLQLLSSKFPETLLARLNEFDMDPTRLTLEIVETRMLYENAVTNENLIKIRKLGIGIAIDDFGKGYSAISYLSTYPVTSLKIDETLIRDCDQFEARQTVIKSIIAIADALNVDVVAEGVESVAQLNCLRQLGCDAVQGFLLGKPGSVADSVATQASLEKFGTEIFAENCAAAAESG